MSQQSAPPPTSSSSSTTGTQLVELFFSCSNLKNLDILSKSDPQVYCYMYDLTKKSWVLCAKTEKINNNLNPRFKETWIVQYAPHIGEQRLMFKVFDVDPNTALNSDDFLGCAYTTLEQVVNRKMWSDDLLSKRGNVHGQLHIACEPLSLNSDKVSFTLRGKNLTKMDWGPFAKSDPFFVICRGSSASQQASPSASSPSHELYRSEIVNKNLNPIWECASITFHRLCHGDMTMPFTIMVYDYDRIGSNDYIGSVELNLHDMRAAYENSTPLKLEGPNAKKSELLVLTFSVQRSVPYVPTWSHMGSQSQQQQQLPPQAFAPPYQPQQQPPQQPYQQQAPPPQYMSAPPQYQAPPVYGAGVGGGPPPQYQPPPTYGAIPSYDNSSGALPPPPAYGYPQQQAPSYGNYAPAPAYGAPPPQYTSNDAPPPPSYQPQQ